ncbi:MAG: type ISP restriction/modification enzyme, partial [Nanopusillaceae archaeon]
MKVEAFFEKLNQSSAKDKGELFENFLKAYFSISPIYSKLFKEVQLWKESLFAKSRKDTGVDLIAIDIENNKWCIQAKYHQDKVGLRDIPTFFSSLLQKEFHGGILVVKSGITQDLENKLQTFQKKVIVLTLDDILKDIGDIDFETGTIQWAETKKELRPYQIEAIEAVISGFKEYDRGKLIMPPGSGKTLTSLKIAEKYLGQKGLVLFCCPSISLLDQSLRVWLKESEVDIIPLAVVSDKSVGKVKEDSLEKLILRESPTLLVYPPTTDEVELLKAYSDVKNRNKQGIIVIFSTYQSLDVIERAQSEPNGLDEFDLIICDEAHRTTGILIKDEEVTNFKKIHDNSYIKGKKRLYMTATPKIYDVDVENSTEDYKIYSMDDEKIYGKTFYEYTFRKAVEEGYLSDFKVIVFGINKKDVQLKAFDFIQKGMLRLEDTTKLYGIFKFLTHGYEDITGEHRYKDLKKGIIFVNTIKESTTIANSYKSLKESFSSSADLIDQSIANLDVEIRHIEGTTTAIARKELLSWLGENNNQKRFLINAKVLTEGIDVPALDMVVFLRPRKSVIDVIQATGRVMRKAEGKDYGYIVIPVLIDPDEPEEEQIARTDYKTIVDILNALRSIDKTFEADIRLLGKKILLSKEEPSDSALEDSSPLTEDEKEFLEKQKKIQRIRIHLHFPFNLEKVLTARVLRKLGLGKKYLETWAKEISNVAKIITDHIKIAVQQNNVIADKFNNFLNILKVFVNENITEEQAILMLVQYMLTKPIFEAMFDKHEDVITKALESITEEFNDYLKKETEQFRSFYNEVSERAKGISDPKEKQDFLRHLYDNFFRIAFKEISDQLGIAYTPVEIVDFMIRISDDLIKREFREEGINSEDIVILEPFAGTGTFLTRIVHYLDEKALEDKYKNWKLWGNEILLLPYYIAKINVETAYEAKTGKREEFKTMLLADSFQMMEKIYSKGQYQLPGILEKYSEILNKQKESKINLIISNPPYFSRTESRNTQVIRGYYENLMRRVKETFGKEAQVTNKNALYDSYIFAIRMGLDRIEEGVVVYVTNNGWLDSNVGQGVRKVLEEELDKIYVVNLRGNLRKDQVKEGGNVFNVRVGICIVFMVKKKNKPKDKKAEIYYYDIGEGLSAFEKLEKLEGFKKIEDIEFERIEPNEKGDWLNQRGEEFYKYLVLGDNKEKSKKGIFNLNSSGLVTSRDSYTWNFSKEKLREYMERLIFTFNQHVERYNKGELTREDIENKRKIELDERKSKWDRELLKEIMKNKMYTIENGGKFYNGIYRPFINQYVYFSKVFNNCVHQLPKVFPYPDSKNLVIVVSNKADNFDVLMVNRIYSIDLLVHALGFPLYIYKPIDGRQENLFNNFKESYKKLSNISDYALNEYRKKYGEDISYEDIF